jgi:hypothetical protein
MLGKPLITMQESSRKAQIIRQLSSKHTWKRTKWTSPSLSMVRAMPIPGQTWLMNSCRWMMMRMWVLVMLREPWLKMSSKMDSGMSKLMDPTKVKRKPRWDSSRVYQATISFSLPSTLKKTRGQPSTTSIPRTWPKVSSQPMEPRVTSWPTSRTIYRVS